MKMRRDIQWIVLILLSMMLFACGSTEKETELTVSGRVTFGNQDPREMGPVFVAVLNKSPMEMDESSMEEAMVAITTIQKDDPVFLFTLSSRVVKPGDRVYLVAFADNDLKNGTPEPGVGDVLGYYINSKDMTPAYVLQAGSNTGIEIAVTKEVFDYEASVSGRILGDTPGQVTVVALAGEITSIDMSQIDPYDVLGMIEVAKGTEPVSFSIDIYPFGFDLPVKDVFLIAMLDGDGDGEMGAGDWVGFYTGGDAMPRLLDIAAGSASGFDITPDLPLADPSGDTLSVGGTIVIPQNLEALVRDIPLFVLAVEADENLDLMSLADGDLNTVANFQRLPAGTRSFDLDLSQSGLEAGDTVVLTVVCDLSYRAGFPDVGVGDYIGYYVDLGKLGPELTLIQGGNPDVSITLNKEVFDYDASLSGHIPAGYTGQATVFPYFGDVSNMDFSNVDMDAVAGFTRLTLTGEAVDFTVPVFPFGQDLPIENGYLMVFLDVNENNMADPGDLLGFYTGESTQPQLVTITGGEQTGFTLEPNLSIPQPSGDTLWLSGQVSVPQELEGTLGDKPVFVVVVRADGDVDFDALSSGDFESIVYFERLPAGQRDFSFDLSPSGLAQGDKVMVITLCDMDFVAGLPEVSAGDYVGYYLDEAAMAPELTLVQGGNSGVDINLTREVFDYEASLSGTVYAEESGSLTLFAYAGDITSFDFAGEIDLEQVIAFQRIEKTTPWVAFNLDVFPYGFDLPINNVFILAWLDTNGNGGQPDAGDLMGFVADENSLPAILSVTGNDPGNLLVNMTIPVPEPSDTEVTLSGRVEVPDDMDVGDQPLCILVIRSGDTLDLTALIEGGLSDLAWYEKLAPNQRRFDIDLAQRGLSPGDQVMVLALCDHQQTVGFPDVNPGDYLGFYQNDATMNVNLTLAAGENTVETVGDTSFKLNRIMYEHSAQLLFELQDDRLQAMDSPESLDPGETATVVIIAEDGVVTGSDEGATVDMDYVIGFGSVTVPETGNDGHFYTLDLLPFIDRRVTVQQDPFAVENVYVFGIFDGNTSGTPDANNYLGYYWRLNWLFIMVPDLVDELINGPNVLDKTVRFTQNTL